MRVVEIEEALVGWMRDGTVPHGPAVLADKRVRVVTADIAMAVAEATSTYDLVLLDVDNGPGYLVHQANEQVYEPDFLAAARRIIDPGGALVIWSATPAPELAARPGGGLRQLHRAPSRRGPAGAGGAVPALPLPRAER